MTNPAMGAAARLHALPNLTMSDPSAGAATVAPATTRTTEQVAALDEFVRNLTSSNGSGDAVLLRLLYGEIHPDDRPLALQVLAPFRESTRRGLVQAATSGLDQNVDETRRQHVRLQEIGVTSDAPDPTATAESSAMRLREFDHLLRPSPQVRGSVRQLRESFVRMTASDRQVAQSMLQQVRAEEQRRTQGIVMAENGEIDPSEYNALRRLANVDAPVEAWEVPQAPDASYSFAAGM